MAAIILMRPPHRPHFKTSIEKTLFIKSDGSYERPGPGRAESLRAQEFLYRQATEEHDRLRAVTPVRFEPLESKH